jgi:CRISPR-associated protein Cmr6
MDIDILTPHHKGYFEGKNTPNDVEDPIPIKYLVVKPGTSYVFQVVHRAVPTEYRGIFKCGKECKELVDDLFTNVISYMGFGAKTRIGYGLFEFKKGWKDEIKALEEGRGESKSRQEQLMREKEKRLKRQTFLESLPVAERRAREFVDEITAKAANEPPRAKVEKVLREVIEKAQDDPEFLKALGIILEKEIWSQPLKLNSQKKNPAKEYDYQVSLKIQDLKNGKLPGKN